jgi:ribonuclease VapC
MFVDASVLLAILLREPDADSYAEQIETTVRPCTSPIALFETASALMARKHLPRIVTEDEIRMLLVDSGIEVLPITEQIGHLAMDAFDRYGKGRGHPAQLNMGDCFAYACAKAHGLRLLYKGNDFSRTDLA